MLLTRTLCGLKWFLNISLTILAEFFGFLKKIQENISDLRTPKWRIFFVCETEFLFFMALASEKVISFFKTILCMYMWTVFICELAYFLKYGFVFADFFILAFNKHVRAFL